MAWSSKFVEFGVAKTEGDKVKVYQDKFTFLTLSIGKPVKYAVWSGNELTVYLQDGKVRKYRDQFTFNVF